MLVGKKAIRSEIDVDFFFIDKSRGRGRGVCLMNLLERFFWCRTTPELLAVSAIEGEGEEPAVIESGKKNTVSGNDRGRETSG